MAQQLVANFLETFQTLEREVDNLVVSNEYQAASDELQKLSKLLSEYAPTLPSYELRKAQSVVSKFQSKILELEEATRSKRKFKFSRKNPEHLKSSDAVAPSIDQSDGHQKTAPEPFLKGLRSVTITLEPDKVNNKDIWLDDLHGCIITIAGIPSTVHLTKLEDCKVIAGPVLTSVFLEECRRSSVVLGCQQLRTHKSHDCDFYLHVRSRAIIEDCTKCRFAPYNREYPGKKQDFAAAQLDPNINNWNQVDDFNWLSTSKPSPNWRVLPEDERIQNWPL